MNNFKKFLAVAIMSAFLLASSITAQAQTNAKTVILGGMPFGLKIFTNGVIVINIDKSSNKSAYDAGIKENDIIFKANDTEINSNEELKNIIESYSGEDIELSVQRDNKTITLNLTPTLDKDGEYVAGMWIRDSTAGIGTITYFDQSTMSFGALGHGICDKDTNILMPLKNGEILSAKISSISKAQKGSAGGLNGYFDSQTIGNITLNNAYGVYGRYSTLLGNKEIQTALDKEITTGDAKIITTIEGEEPKSYDIKIETLNLSDVSGQNMVIKVVDKDLLEKTGGIVQGMSGSPILQNGKLIGAVTHVFVNSPDKGYGITISNMLSNYDEFG